MLTQSHRDITKCNTMHLQKTHTHIHTPAGGQGNGARAIVTVLTSDAYEQTARVLGAALRRHGESATYVLLATDAVSSEAATRLAAAGWRVRRIASLPNPHAARRAVPARFRDTFTKLRAWQLDEFERVLLLDADTLLVRPLGRALWADAAAAVSRTRLAAVPDCCDRFNSGVVLLVPDAAVFADMRSKLTALPSYDGGDQVG